MPRDLGRDSIRWKFEVNRTNTLGDIAILWLGLTFQPSPRFYIRAKNGHNFQSFCPIDLKISQDTFRGNSRSCAKFQLSTIILKFLLSPNILTIVKRKDGFTNALLQIIGQIRIENFSKNSRKMKLWHNNRLLEKTLTLKFQLFLTITLGDMVIFWVGVNSDGNPSI